MNDGFPLAGLMREAAEGTLAFAEVCVAEHEQAVRAGDMDALSRLIAAAHQRGFSAALICHDDDVRSKA